MNDVKFSGVHQYHQNSRLFLEPTFPDESGCSTCQLCGLPAHDGCSSCASVSDDPDGYERGPLRKQKVSFDVPRRSTMNRSSASAPLSTSIDETETRGRNLLVSEHNPSVSLESDVVCGRYMQPRKFSESKTDPVHDTSEPPSPRGPLTRVPRRVAVSDLPVVQFRQDQVLSWNSYMFSVVRGDCTGPPSGTWSQKDWEPLLESEVLRPLTQINT
ncbi:hypothetical protein FHG87_002708 [Trinorchestia longiramus]|nr:hypothetical protein FHG87_002708 [Trinorchestia longiramus]